MKTGRNERCPCGSGLKYKHCCSDRKRDSVFEEAQAAALGSLEFDEALRQQSLAKLQEIAGRPDLSALERRSVCIALAQAHQNLGQHRMAIECLDRLAESQRNLAMVEETIWYLKALSLRELGHVGTSIEAFDALRSHWQEAGEPEGEIRRRLGLQLIEAGKSYEMGRQTARARECWEQAIRYLSGFSESEHTRRAQSNLAYLDLYDPDPTLQARGLAESEQLIHSKLGAGDLQGAAANFCNLGTYYRKEERYERSIAYYRRDLYLSRLIGEQRQLAVTLGNFATLYADLNQFEPARNHLREAKAIGEQLRDDRLLAITDHQTRAVEEMARTVGMAGETIGPRAPCKCKSGKTYPECCGRADSEPVDLTLLYGGVSEDVAKIRTGLPGTGPTTQLDYILRSTPEAQRRRAWCRIGVHDGWLSMQELPDMANIHWLSAKALAGQPDGADSLHNALGAIVLSVCYLEAFINQLAFFLHEHRADRRAVPFGIPAQLESNGPLEYQRYTSLEIKWSALCASLLGSGWLEQQSMWKEVQDLIYIRNELVHFKAAGYEQVVPPSRTPHKIYSRVPSTVELRTVHQSWPMRILTPKLASWAVDVSERAVDGLREAYRVVRQSQPTPGE